MIALAFLAGLFLGSFVGVGVMCAVIASGGHEQDEDFLSQPVELERRSLVRWKGLKVLP